MLSEIVSMFSGLNLISLVALCVGIILCIVEFIIPGFGVCGILGIILNLFSIIFMIFIGGTVAQVLLLLGTVIILLVIILLFAVRSLKKGVLSRSPLVENSVSIPVDYADNSTNYGFLQNAIGITTTVCKPVGNIMVDNKIYQVISIGKYLNKNVKVKVFEVDGSSIFVKELD